MFKIDNAVPVPQIRRGGAGSKYPWADMKAGQSFFVSADNNDDAARIKRNLYSNAVNFVRRNELELWPTVAIVDEEDYGFGVRVWLFEKEEGDDDGSEAESSDEDSPEEDDIF